MAHLGEHNEFEEDNRLSLMAADITNNWIDNGNLSIAIPNFSEPFLINYGYAILEIYKRHLLGKDLQGEDILLKVNWIDYQRYIQTNSNKLQDDR
jgi:hypothetical protein